MTPSERKTTFALASIYAFRMLGLFMILPIFSLYINRIPGATPLLMGFALGIYGLTQGVLQIPFGACSDRFGRKPVIIFGLALFMIGSIIAARAHSIQFLILGRGIQGAGAVGSTLTALLADNTTEENRLKAMSSLGMTIGLAFMLALLLGPLLNSWIGLAGIFWFTAGLAGLSIVVLLKFVPTPPGHFLQRDSAAVFKQFKPILTMPELLRLDAGIFCLHALLTALFVVIPLILVDQAGLAENQQWMIYFPVLLIAFVLMLPFIILAEVKRQMRWIFIGAILVLTISQVLLARFHLHPVMIALILVFFFAAFTFLESSLPSLIAKIAPAGSKGTAMGIYSSAQFLGILAGGSFAGFCYGKWGPDSVFALCTGLGLVWLLIALGMKNPRYLSSKTVTICPVETEVAAKALQLKFLEIPGVIEAFVSPQEKTAYLKIDKILFSETKLRDLFETTKPTAPAHSTPTA